nr:prostaglandin E2 receptor EP1 subtype-like [Lytechinus pictus]
MSPTTLNSSILQAGEGGLLPDLQEGFNVLQLSRRAAAEPPGLNFTAMVALQPSTTILIPIIMFSIGLIGNIIALGVYYCSSSWHRATAFYGILRGFFITSLVGYLTIYPTIIAVHINGLHWIGGSRMCEFHGFCVLSFGMSLAYMTGFLGFERFLAACRPLTYNRKVEPRKIPFVLVLLWVVSVFTGILPLVGFGQISLHYPSTWCFINWRDEETVGRLFSSVLATIIIAIILLVIVSILAATIGAILRTCKRCKDTTAGKENERGRYSLTLTIDDNSHRIPRRFFAADRALLWATIHYALLACGFLVCYIPIVMRIIANVSGQRINHFKDMAAMHWAEFYPAFCPWLYILCHEQIWMRLTCRKPAYRDVPYSRQSLRRRSTRGRRSSGRGHECIRESNVRSHRESLSMGTSNHVNVVMHDHVDGYAVVGRQDGSSREEEPVRGRSARKKLDFIKEDDVSNGRSPQSPSAANSPVGLPTTASKTSPGGRIRSSSSSSTVSSTRSPTKEAPRSPSSSSTASIHNANRSPSASSVKSLPKSSTTNTPRSPTTVTTPPSSVTDRLIISSTDKQKTKLIVTNSFPVANGPVIQNHVNATRSKSSAASTTGGSRKNRKGEYSRVPTDPEESVPPASITSKRTTYAKTGRKESSI